jgi:hypothetical protein
LPQARQVIASRSCKSAISFSKEVLPGARLSARAG